MLSSMDDAEIQARAAGMPVGTIWDTGTETVTIAPHCIIIEPHGLHDEAYELITREDGGTEIRPHRR